MTINNKMKKIILCIIISNFFINNASASIYKILQYRLNKIENFHSYFTQKIINHKGKLIQTGKGEIWLKHPNKFNFLFILPDTMNIVSNGKILWIFNPIINQVNISYLKDTINPLIFIIDHNKLIKNLKFFKITKKNNDFLLIPTKENNNINFKKVSINISRIGIINNLVITDYNYHSCYYFRSQNNTRVISEKKFIFSIPKESIIDDQRS